MKIFINQLSPPSRLALAVGNYVGASLEVIDVNLAAREQESEDYLRKNLNGKVPTLVDGDF